MSLRYSAAMIRRGTLSRCAGAIAVAVPVFIAVAVGAGPAASAGGTGDGDRKEAVRIAVRYESPGEGRVSLALFDEAGVLVRTLLAAQPVGAGEATVHWDGTTDLGLPARAGRYAAKGVFFPEPPRLEYVMSVGKSGDPPYRTADGKGDWGANLGPGTSIVANDDSLVMGFGAVEDNQITGIQQTDATGTIERRYYSFYGWDQRMAAAMNATHYYLGIYDFNTKRTEIGVYTLGESRGEILARLPVKATPTRSGRWKGRMSSNIDGMAVSDERLFASVAHADRLFILDRETGKVLREAELTQPRGLAVSQQRLLAISGRKVLALDFDGKRVATLVEEGTLEAPSAIAVDAAGNIYVGDSGAGGVLDPERRGGTRQVHVFDPDGKPLRKLGAKGGTPVNGRFDRDGFGTIYSLCIGPQGDLWAMDIATGFWRTSRWSTQGKLKQQWFHRRLSHVADQINPGNPNELISTRPGFNDEPGIWAYTIDLDAGTWEPAWHYGQTIADLYAPAAGVFLSHDHSGIPLKVGNPELRWPIFEYSDVTLASRGGRSYMLNGQGNNEGVLYTITADHAPRPVAMVSFHRAERRDGRYVGFYDQGPNNWLTWSDHDGDGKMSDAEVIYTEDPESLRDVKRVYAAALEPDLSIRLLLLLRGEKGEVIRRAVLKPREVSAEGVPVYDWSDLRLPEPYKMPEFRGGDGSKTVGDLAMTMPISGGEGGEGKGETRYAIVDPGKPEGLRLPGIDGEGWWASRNWRKKLVAWDADTGRLRWAVGRRAPGRAQPGQMYNPIMVAGKVGDAVLVADGLAVVWAWHDTGLYLGRLYNDFATDITDDQSLYIELQGTQTYTHPRTGQHYSIANDTASHIHRVHLPETTPITGDTVELTADMLPRIQPWDPDGPPPGSAPQHDVHTLGDKTVTIDGKLDGHEGWFDPTAGVKREPMQVLLDGQRLAKVTAMYDADHLYLAYQVDAPHGPLNAGSELPLAPFVSGAYVDFKLAPTWDGPRDSVSEGDVRVIVARIRDGDGFANYHRAFYPVKDKGTQSQTITSPAARVRFDHVAPVPGLEMAYHVEEADSKSQRTAYTVELAVPWDALGVSDPAGEMLGFDASVAVSNAAGDRRERAASWAGVSEAVVVDRPGSTRLLPATWGTLRFIGGE